MLPILLCTILGFLAGLAWVMKRRGIRARQILTGAFLALLSSALFKFLKNYFDEYNRGNFKRRW